jgi:uncharacterized protein (UPF0332 family)
VPEDRFKDLSRYRLERSEAMLQSAKRDFIAKDYSSANNRAYYSLFHAIRSILALDGKDFKSHSAVIARFSQDYLKTELIPRSFSKLIATASLIRNRSDYEDFYVCSIDDTDKLIAGADNFLRVVKAFLSNR